jgi:hypothetical protein
MGRHEARVIDLSEGGASLSGRFSLNPGASGSLELDGVGFPLPFQVVQQEADELHVAFTLDAAAAAAFRPMPAQLGRPLALAS